MCSAVIPFFNIHAETSSIQEAYPSSPPFYPVTPSSSPSAEKEEPSLNLSEEFLVEMQTFDQKESGSEELKELISEEHFIPAEALEQEELISSLDFEDDDNQAFSTSKKSLNLPEEENFDQKLLEITASLEKEIPALDSTPSQHLELGSKKDKTITISALEDPLKENMTLELVAEKEIIPQLVNPEMEQVSSFLKSEEITVPEIDFLPEPANDLFPSTSLYFENSPKVEESVLALPEPDLVSELKAEENPIKEVQLLSKHAIESIENKIASRFDSSPELSANKHLSQELAAKIDDTVKESPSVFSDPKKLTSTLTIDLRQVFSGSPLIYSTLLILSIASFCIWFYSLFSLKRSISLSAEFLKNLRTKLVSNQYEDALTLCMQQDSFFSRMLASGISSRRYGAQVLLEAMKAEGKRATVSFWQKIALLNDIAIIAPMIGLLGTVLGMFYAFYDLNRSLESVSALFDGLGISVGTTVAGLLVAIISMIFHSLARFRLVKALTHVENEANSFASLIDSKVSVFEDKGV
jgi:biopolymer transport protein ExbB